MTTSERPPTDPTTSDRMNAPASVESPRLPSAEPQSVIGPARPAGHGQRLTAAFDALERFPALAESRNRVLALVAEERPSGAEVVGAIESDVALVIAVLRLANQVEGQRRGRVESIVEAVDVLSPE